MKRLDLVTNGCTGKCCENFHFSATQTELAAIREMPEVYKDDPETLEKWASAIFVANMLTPMPPKDGHARWTCKHFDTEKRICTEYANRPPLCRAHPVAGIDCGFDESCTCIGNGPTQLWPGGLFLGWLITRVETGEWPPEALEKEPAYQIDLSKFKVIDVRYGD